MNQSDFQGELKAELEDELERLHPASFGWALFCCDRRREEAEEVLQTAYLKVLDGRASFNGWSSLRTWFFAVIRRTAWEQRRRRWLRENLLGGWVKREPTMPRAADPEILLSLSENAEAVRKAVASLPARQREVLHLVFYQDLTIEEAAHILKVSLGTARTHFERGKARLRQLLQPIAPKPRASGTMTSQEAKHGKQ
jgi:RNA polymerase sigma-70 factor (ECF subfamily)